MSKDESPYNYLERITAKQISGVIAGFVGCVAPGFLAIYYYRPELVQELDVVKLLLFSASITTPVFSFNCLMLADVFDRYATHWDEKVLMSSVFISAMALYGALFLVQYAPSRQLRFFLVAVMLLECLLSIGLSIGRKIQKRRDKVAAANIDIRQAIADIIKKMSSRYVFDSHFIIDILTREYSKAYSDYIQKCDLKDNRRAWAHGQIGKMIAVFEGTDLVRLENKLSKNINGDVSECAAWEKI